MLARTALVVVLAAGSLAPSFAAPVAVPASNTAIAAVGARDLDARAFSLSTLLKTLFRGVPRDLAEESGSGGDITQEELEELQHQIHSFLAADGKSARDLDARAFSLSALLKTLFRGVPRRRDEGDLTQDEAEELQHQLATILASRDVDARAFSLSTLLKTLFRGVPRRRSEESGLTQDEEEELQHQLAILASRDVDARAFSLSTLLKTLFRGVPRRRSEEGDLTQDDVEELQHQLAILASRDVDARAFSLSTLLKTLFRGVPRRRSPIDLDKIRIGTTVKNGGLNDLD